MAAPLETEKPRGIAALFGGSPQQVLRAFDIAWPAVLESVFVALAGLIDSLMVSTLGAAAVASVGLTTQPKFIALSLFIALNVSVSALVARRKGQKDRDGANQVLMMALGFTLVMGLVLGAVCIAFAPTFMDLAGSNAETHDNAVLYFRIVVGGMIFSVLSLIINAAQRGSGNTRLSMRANVASSLVNITFNWLLINGHLGFPALGMKGAALATGIGQTVSVLVYLVIYFVRPISVRINRQKNLESEIHGLYPCGEGAGYAGGITSAAMDGLKVAESIIKKYRKF